MFFPPWPILGILCPTFVSYYSLCNFSFHTSVLIFHYHIRLRGSVMASLNTMMCKRKLVWYWRGVLQRSWKAELVKRWSINSSSNASWTLQKVPCANLRGSIGKRNIDLVKIRLQRIPIHIWSRFYGMIYLDYIVILSLIFRIKWLILSLIFTVYEGLTYI